MYNLIKKIKFAVLLTVIMTATSLISCNKKDITNSTDIAQFEWELKSLTIEGIQKKTPHKDDNSNVISNENAYKLVFENDSTYSLNLSINDGQGRFNCLNKGSVTFDDLGLTKACCESEFDEELIEALKLVTSYQVISNSLILSGENSEMEFKK